MSDDPDRHRDDSYAAKRARLEQMKAETRKREQLADRGRAARRSRRVCGADAPDHGHGGGEQIAYESKCEYKSQYKYKYVYALV